MPSYTKKAIDSAVALLIAETGLKLSLQSIQKLNGEVRQSNRPLFNIVPARKLSVADAQLSRVPTITVSLVKLTSKNSERLGKYNSSARISCSCSLTHEKLEALQALTYEYVDGLIDLLQRSLGLWTEGVFYAGDFNAIINSAQSGSLNFSQTAVIEFDLTLWQV